MDIFPTALAAAEVAAPQDRVIDGKDLLPLLTGKVREAHDVIFGQQGPRLATVRDAQWKLHVRPAGSTLADKPPSPWVDPRA